MLVLDTCALLWHSLDPDSLSIPAHDAIEAADTLLISTISLWEIALKAKKGELVLPMSMDLYTQKLNEVDKYRIIPVETMHWLESVRLDWSHRDPADRLIVALAGLYRSGLVSADTRMKVYYPSTVW